MLKLKIGSLTQIRQKKNRYKPKDKTKADVGVKVVGRWIMKRPRHQTFFSLAAINQAIRFLLDDLNRRPFEQRPGSRASTFASLDQPALRPLPAQPYVYRDIKQAQVQLDYHVAYDQHFYSVPYQLVKQTVSIHADQQLITIHHGSKQVAQHPRVFGGGHSTDPNHMAKAHLKHQEWSPQRFLYWAAQMVSTPLMLSNTSSVLGATPSMVIGPA